MGLLYRQTRIGLNGRPFTLLKVETVRGGVVTRPRLRRWGLDELPQVVNIARGEMALFGPRPELPDVHARCSAELGETWDSRLRAKPGVLSLAAVAGRIRTDARYGLDTKAEQAVLDNVQVDEWGPRMALAILRRLPAAIRRGQP